MVEHGRCFPACIEKCQEHKKLSAFYHPHKMGCAFNHGLYLLCNTIYGWSPPPFPDGYKNIPGCKKLSVFRHLHKTDPKFNYKLYFIQNSHRDVIFATKYNHRLNSLAIFRNIRRYVGLQKHLSAFRHPHKNDLKYNRGLNFIIFYNLIDHHIKTNPHKKQTRVGTWRGIQNVVNIKNPRPGSIIGCVSGLVRWGDISKSLKTKIGF